MSIFRILASFACAVALLPAARGEYATATNAAAINALFRARGSAGTPFDLCVGVSYPCSPSNSTLCVWDETGATVLAHNPVECTGRLRAGDRIRVRGEIFLTTNGFYTTFITNFTVLTRGEPPPVPTVTPADLASGRYDRRVVRVTGVLTDLLSDDIDPKNAFLVLADGGESVLVSVLSKTDFSHLIGRHVSAFGALTRPDLNWRRQIGRCLNLFSDDGLRPLFPDEDRFAAPELPHDLIDSPDEIAHLGQRRVRGQVLAVGKRRHLILKTAAGDLMQVALCGGTPPACGASVEVVGFTQTDLYSTSLLWAEWRPSDELSLPVAEPEPATLRRLCEGKDRQPRVNMAMNGALLRVEGRVVSLPAAANGDGCLSIEDGGYRLSVDASAIPRLPDALRVGARAAFTGVFSVETERWRGQTDLPRVLSPTLILRTADDIAVLSRAPFWTPARLVAFIVVLAVTLVVLLVRLRFVRLRAELKTRERTRLAVELHDSLAQTLAGVSLELESARDREGEDRLARINVAAKALKSCRDGLRNCLWDLRNEALENPSLAEAIRQTLAPHLGEARLDVRVSAPRKAFSDNAAHAVFCIVRELVLNALRHGGATHVRIAGVLDDGTFRASVTDDGRGFEPSAAPGVLQGHFGLQGIRERLALLGGTFAIERQTRGMRASFTLPPAKLKA